MSKWKRIKLRDICDLNMGQSPKSSSYNQDGDGIPFYQGNADFGETHPKTRYYCSQPTKIAHKGDILLSVRAPIGALNIATETCCIGRGLASISARKDLSDMKFLYYVLRGKNAELNQKGTGSTFKAINKKNLSELWCPLPPLEAQRKIAETLDTVSEILAMRKQQLAELDNLIKSIFYDMFGDPVGNEKGLEKRKLGDLGVIKSGGTPSRARPAFFKGKVPWITTVALGETFIDDNDAVEFITEDAIKNSSTKQIKANSILFGIRVGVGKTSINRIPMCTNQDIVAIENINKDLLHQVFLIKTLTTFTEYFSEQKRGATIKGITTGILKSIEIPIPPLASQTRFANLNSLIEDHKSLVRKALDETQYLLDSLMSRYFD